MANKVIVFIGRFQPVHNGHASILNRMFKNPTNFGIILVGSAFQARTVKNPLSYVEREGLISDYLDSIGVQRSRYVIVPVMDFPYNDAKWILSVQESVECALNTLKKHNAQIDSECFLMGSDRDSSTWYLSAFPQFKLVLIDEVCGTANTNLNATNIRALLFSNSENDAWNGLPLTSKNWLLSFMQTAEFSNLRAEFEYIRAYKHAWAASPYPFNNVCTDAVVIQSGHVLLIKRAALPGKGLWALPGGHVNQNERLVDACVRELIEETGIKIPQKILRASIVAQTCFDVPDRSLLGRCYSHTFVFQLDNTMPLPRVKGQNAPLADTGGKIEAETLKAKWVPFSVAFANPEWFFDDHYSIICWAIDNNK